MDRDEAGLVEAALGLRFDDFCVYMGYWDLHVDPDGAASSDVERRERRRVSLDETFNGMYSGSVLLDPVSGSAVAGELDRLERELFEADWAEAKERLGRDPKVGELARTPDQRRADALVEMAKRCCPGSVRPTSSVLVRGLRRPGHQRVETPSVHRGVARPDQGPRPALLPPGLRRPC